MANSADASISSTRSRSSIDVAVLVSAIALVYVNSLSGVFLFDDNNGIIRNVAIRDIASLQWLELRARPITTLSFAINYALGGLDPIGYHLVNLLLHIANASLLYWLVAKATQRHGHWLALMSALLWAVHPLGTAAVTYVIQRSELLVTCGLLLMLTCWTKAAEETSSRFVAMWRLAVVLAAAAAYGSKESAAFLLVILLLYDRTMLAQSWQSMKVNLGWYLAIAAPLVVGTVVYAAAFFSGNHRDPTVGFAIPAITPLNYLASQPFVFARYLQLSFLPIDQVLDYGWLPSKSPPWMAAGCVGWAMILTAVLYLLRWRPRIGFLIASALLILLPSSSLVPLQDIIFEHRMYAPLMAISILVVATANWFATASRGDQASLARWRLGIGVLVAACLGTATISRNQDYHSRQRLLSRDASRSPDNPRVWANLADETDFDDPDDQIAMYRKSFELYERRGFYYAGTRYKLSRAIGDLYWLTGRFDQASDFYAIALSSANDDQQTAEIHFSLALISSASGQTLAADQHFQSAITNSRQIRDFHLAYAAHLRRSGRSAEAEDQEAIADTIPPDDLPN